jgi:ABC-2 type transport system permease protein
MSFCSFGIFRVNVGPTARVSPEMMQTAQQEMTELPKCILRNYGISIASILIDLWFTLLAAIFYTVPLRQLAPQ